MTIELAIYQPHQIIRTTNQTGTVIHSFAVNDDGTLSACDAGLNSAWAADPYPGNPAQEETSQEESEQEETDREEEPA